MFKNHARKQSTNRTGSDQGVELDWRQLPSDRCLIKVQSTVTLMNRGFAMFTYHRLWGPGFCWRCGGVPGWDAGDSPRVVNWCSTAESCCATGPNLRWRCVVNATQETGCVDSGWRVKTHPWTEFEKQIRDKIKELVQVEWSSPGKLLGSHWERNNTAQESRWTTHIKEKTARMTLKLKQRNNKTHYLNNWP